MDSELIEIVMWIVVSGHAATGNLVAIMGPRYTKVTVEREPLFILLEFRSLELLKFILLKIVPVSKHAFILL